VAGPLLAACAETLYRALPRPERLRRLGAHGLEAEVWTVAAGDADALAATGVPVRSITGYREGTLLDEAGAGRLLETAREAIGVALQIGAPHLNLHGTGLGPCGLPVVPGTEVSAAGRACALRTLERLAELGAAHGLRFCLENLNPVDHPGVPFSAARDTLALVAAVDHPALRLNLDLYHCAMSGEGLPETLAACAPWLGEVQVADAPGRCEPGTGTIDWDAVVAALCAIGFAGVVAFEGFARAGDDVAVHRFVETFAR
jgi:hydroxypyruvate isomerase